MNRGKGSGSFWASVLVVVTCVSVSPGAVQPSVPETITTTDGKTYHRVTLWSVEPDGLSIAYAPAEGGIGMRKVKFRNLPEALRNDFKYDEQAAADFEAARARALEQWRSERAAKGSTTAAEEDRTEAFGTQNYQYPVGRFRAAGTILGAIIIDTLTGQTWMADLHSTIVPQDHREFLAPKVTLNDDSANRAYIIGP